jgi:hypothetical protein
LAKQTHGIGSQVAQEREAESFLNAFHNAFNTQSANLVLHVKRFQAWIKTKLACISYLLFYIISPIASS